MAKFTDGKGDAWEVTITYQTVLDVEKECDVDLLAISENDAALWKRLHTDAKLVMACLKVACAEQIAKAKYDDNAFFNRIFGDSLGDAQQAFMEALYDFIPNPETRAALRGMETKIRQLTTRVMEINKVKVMRIVEEFDVEAEAQRVTNFVGSGLGS